MCPPLQYEQILSGKGPSFTFFSDSVPLSTEPVVVAKLLPCGFKQCGDSLILPSLLAASSFCHMPPYVAYLSAYLSAAKLVVKDLWGGVAMHLVTMLLVGMSTGDP